MFAPSVYQQAVFDWIEKGSGNAVVNAVAGSGKTTTLLQAATRLKVKRALFVAFNKLIADELAVKLQESGSIMRASTIHSLGKSSIETHIGKARVVGNKYIKICRSYLKSQGIENEQIIRSLNKLVGFVQLTLVKPTDENLVDIVEYYDLKDISVTDDTWFIISPAVNVVLTAGVQQAIEEHIIDFNDMVWLPNVVDGITPPQYDFIFVDECQDLNAAQLELVLKCCAPHGRFLFVGDRRQSLYGFAGADTESVNKIVKRTSAIELPLSICYRCPTSHVELAKQVVPEIEPSPYAAPGEIGIVPAGLLAKVDPSSENTVAILCRTTAPLVSACLKMLQTGKRAIVRGKDIGASIIDIVDKISSVKRRAIGVYELPEALAKYKAIQFAALQVKEDNELLIESLYDRCDTVEALYSGYFAECKESGDTPSIDGLKVFIESKFDDTVSDDCFIYSTVHKSKGLEFHSVYILNPQNKLMPHPAAKSGWQIAQEYNIVYVALTRSKRCLYFLDAAIPWLVLPDGVLETSVAMEQITEHKQESTEEKVKRGRGRPRKAGDTGAIRDRVNVSMDVDVIRFLRSQKNYSELLESLVLALPEFDEFLKSE